MPDTTTPDETRRNGDDPRAPAAAEARVTSEPLTYEIGAPHSYFRDLALAMNRSGTPDENRLNPRTPEGRLHQHGEEMRVELVRRDEQARDTALRGGVELRVNPNRAPGQGGYFAPPLWLIDRFATAPRVGRILADLIPKFPLPQGVQSVSLPRLTTGEQAAVGADLDPATSQDELDAAASSPVVTIAGQGDVALQLLEQSPPGAHLDWAIFKDLRGDYDAKLEAALLNGTGANGQFYGILNLPIPTANQVVYTDATPTGPRLYPFLGQMAAAIGDNRQMPPEIWLMRTARWAWLGVAQDNNAMPLAVPQHTPPGEIPYLFDDRRATPVTAILGWPLYVDDALPGAGAGTADAIVACRPTDMLLLESEPRAAVMLEPVSGTLEARLQLHAYAAAITGRYPSGIARLTGTGLTVQTGF